MIRKLFSFLVMNKVVKILILKLINRQKSLIVKSEFVHLKTNVGNNVTIMEGTATDHLTHIGDYCYIGRYCYLTKVKIGNFCSIANNVSIGQGEHDLSKISTSSIFYENTFEELTKKDCIIGNDVWIGTNAIIMRGVKVGTGAVIGAGTIVTKNVPAFAVVVGVPARILKYRFEEEKQNQILESKWFEKDLDEAKFIIKKLELND